MNNYYAEQLAKQMIDEKKLAMEYKIDVDGVEVNVIVTRAPYINVEWIGEVKKGE